MRIDFAFSPLELASVGFFYKDLEDPIELVSAVETTNYIDLYVNADTATVWGFELEGRKDFSFAVPYASRVGWLEGVAPMLADLQFMANISIVESSVEGFTAPPADDRKDAPVTDPCPAENNRPRASAAGLIIGRLPGTRTPAGMAELSE